MSRAWQHRHNRGICRNPVLRTKTIGIESRVMGPFHNRMSHKIRVQAPTFEPSSLIGQQRHQPVHKARNIPRPALLPSPHLWCNIMNYRDLPELTITNAIAITYVIAIASAITHHPPPFFPQPGEQCTHKSPTVDRHQNIGLKIFYIADRLSNTLHYQRQSRHNLEKTHNRDLGDVKQAAKTLIISAAIIGSCRGYSSKIPTGTGIFTDTDRHHTLASDPSKLHTGHKPPQRPHQTRREQIARRLACHNINFHRFYLNSGWLILINPGR